MIDRQKALEILNKNIKNKNLIKHCIAVESAMKALAGYFYDKGELKENNSKDRNETVKLWGLAGLLHDADWELSQNNPSQHTKKTVEWLKQLGETDQKLTQAILSHNYTHNGENPPRTLMEWALYTCDELTGLIVAVALVRPDKRLSSVTVKSVLKKFSSKAFAAGVNRDQIKQCEEKINIKLEKFIDIVLKAMQRITKELEL